MSHLRAIGDHEPDTVLVAERLLGAPWRPAAAPRRGSTRPA